MKTDPYPSIDKIEVTENGVLKLLSNLDIYKATGPDNISTHLLKTLAPELASIFTVFFQASLDHGNIPAEWKDANVVPIFKKGDRSQASNYRPVSLTAILCKLLEHIICSNIHKHLEQHSILTDAQHGFRKERSCESQLILTINDLAKNIDNRGQIDLILLDFSKAFDKVPHERLLHKINHYGIRGTTQSWLRDFLSDRHQKVLLEGEHSDTAPVRSGVPQGSVLGPLMFLIFINDLPEYVTSSHVRLFADDCVLYHQIKTTSDTETLQRDLDGLQQWESDWQMQFHPQKCQLLRITNKKSPVEGQYNIHGHTLEEVDSAKYLGVTIHRTLNWNHHINNISKRANSTRAFLQRNLRSCPTKTKALCYQTLLRPLMEYSCTIWDPSTQENINKLEAVQRRTARFVNNNYDRTSSVTTMLQSLNWEPLQQRRARYKVIMMYRIVHGLIAIPPSTHLTPRTTNTRQNRQFSYLVPYARTESYRYSFFPDTIRLWNGLPESMTTCTTLDAFKSGVQSIQVR